MKTTTMRPLSREQCICNEYFLDCVVIIRIREVWRCQTDDDLNSFAAYKFLVLPPNLISPDNAMEKTVSPD